MQNFLSKRQGGGAPCNTQESYTFRLKRAWNLGIFSSSTVKVSYARGRATPKSYTYIKTKIGPEIKHFHVENAQFS